MDLTNPKRNNGAARNIHPDIPADTTFFWRNGKWLQQAPDGTLGKPVAKRIGLALDSLKTAGILLEASPGQFRLRGLVQSPLIDTSESPLARMMQMKSANGSAYLDAEQFRAGERLRRDFEMAHLQQRTTMSYGGQGGGAVRNAQFSDNHIEALTDRVMAARQTLHRALDAVGPELSGVLYHVCCMAGGLEQAELRLELPRRSGKAVLQLALTRLARHYGYKQVLRHAGPGQIGHWAVEGFRPAIAGQPGHQP